MIILIRLTFYFCWSFLHAMLWLSLPQGLFASCRGRTAHVQTLSTFSFDVGDRKQPCRKLSNLLKRTNGWRRTSSINSSDFIIEAFHRNWNQIWSLENQTITQPPIYYNLFGFNRGGQLLHEDCIFRDETFRSSIALSEFPHCRSSKISSSSVRRKRMNSTRSKNGLVGKDFRKPIAFTSNKSIYIETIAFSVCIPVDFIYYAVIKWCSMGFPRVEIIPTSNSRNLLHVGGSFRVLSNWCWKPMNLAWNTPDCLI